MQMLVSRDERVAREDNKGNGARPVWGSKPAGSEGLSLLEERHKRGPFRRIDRSFETRHCGEHRRALGRAH